MASIAISGAVSYLHLRHVTLALLAILAPLPGLFAASAAFASTPLSGLIAAYGLGTVAAALCAGAIARRVLDAGDAAEAAQHCFAELALPLAAGAVAAAALETGWLVHSALPAGVGDSLAAACCIVSAFFYVVLFCSVLAL